MASEYPIPATTQYAMNLCLEEIVSNIIRHGYDGDPDKFIVVRYISREDGSSVLVVDDEAPAFNPLAIEEMPVAETLDGLGEHRGVIVQRAGSVVHFTWTIKSIEELINVLAR